MYKMIDRVCGGVHAVRRILLGWELGRSSYFAAVLLLFFLAFYLPLSAKFINNIYYVGLAVPGLFLALASPRALMGLLKDYSWFFGLLFVFVVINAAELADLKKWLYLFVFFVVCVFVERSRWTLKRCFTYFSLVSSGVFVFVFLEWLWMWWVGDQFVRYAVFLGGDVNPVYFSVLISMALIFLWLFHFDDWLSLRSKALWFMGFFVFMSLVLLCATIFQSRTTILSLSIFLFGYAIYKNVKFYVFSLVVLLLVLAFFSGSYELLLERGFSYRLVIWQDALRRVVDVCGIWWGCGSDGYLFLGEFYHAHSGYMALFYRTGLGGVLVFSALAGIFLWRSTRYRSRWLLLALFGWGSLLTTTNGVLTSPQPLWIYCWLPIFMTLLEGPKEAIDRFFSARLVDQGSFR